VYSTILFPLFSPDNPIETPVIVVDIRSQVFAFTGDLSAKARLNMLVALALRFAGSISYDNRTGEDRGGGGPFPLIPFPLPPPLLGARCRGGGGGVPCSGEGSRFHF